MTVNDAANLLARKFYGGDVSDDSGFDIEDFEFAVNQASAYLKNKKYWESRNQDGEKEADPTWLRTFPDIPVLFDEQQQLYYADLPQEPLSLPSGRGIALVCGMQSPEKPFMAMEESESFLFSNLPTNYTSYWLVNSKLQFKNLNPMVDKVKAVYVPLFDDDLQDDFAFEVIEIAYAQFLKGKMIPEDKSNDSNPNMTGGK